MPSQLYRTQDGLIFIMCNKEKFWPELCRAIGRPEWSARPEYKDFKARLANRARLTEELDAALSARTTAEWIEIFGGRVPAAPVNDVRRPREPVRGGAGPRAHRRSPNRPHPPARPIDQLPRRGAAVRAAPAMGADTDAVLSEAGLWHDECSLRSRRAEHAQSRRHLERDHAASIRDLRRVDPRASMTSSLAQLEALDLAGGRLRQAVDELDPAGVFPHAGLGLDVLLELLARGRWPAVLPGFSTMKALGFRRPSPSSLGTTAASSTASWPISALSTSNGDTQMPDTLNMSSVRPW